ncbi:MAG: hypothetical protein QHI38_12330 [Armatimonadota bacterium]|nr:hypothetical protein [Armatimonadota bacterium]
MRRLNWVNGAMKALSRRMVLWLGLIGAVVSILVVAGFTDLSPHPAIELLDYSGRPIDPNSSSAPPYSPRQTCGACHDYEKISKCYHVQLGADQISDDYGAKIGRPWISSNGMFGRQIHMSYLWVAKKRNPTAAHIAMTPYEYSQACGFCHVGGGPMELDRNGRRYDVVQSKHPELADSLDGDYHKAAWNKSGVVEIDCLMCHLAGYDGEARRNQLSKANFKWAATAGAGLGTVRGSVKDGEVPQVAYRKDLFNEDGTVSLKIGPPRDSNCLLCHGEAEVKKRGHVWYDTRQTDVHTAAGMQCITCHTSGPDHQIRKGRANEVMLHNELDDPTLSCEGCHMGSGSKLRPTHKSIPKSHLTSIACVTCHVTEHNVAAVGAVDTLTGAAVGLPTAKTAKKYGETCKWIPAYFRLKDGKIYSGNALLPVWWGNRVGGVIYPLLLSETAKAYEKVKSVIRDDNGDGKPEANTEAEIAAMLRAIRDVLVGGRFSRISPAYVKGDRVWQLSGDRVISIRYHPQAQPLKWTFSHNVSPASKALGAGGCKDCHTENSQFFYSPVVVDPFDASGQPVTVPMWEYAGVKRSVVGVQK